MNFFRTTDTTDTTDTTIWKPGFTRKTIFTVVDLYADIFQSFMHGDVMFLSISIVC